jgi:hypothetical protein
MGECPDDYALIQAAKYLGVAPWDLMRQPTFWKIRALKYMRIENEAIEQKKQLEK